MIQEVNKILEEGGTKMEEQKKELEKETLVVEHELTETQTPEPEVAADTTASEEFAKKEEEVPAEEEKSEEEEPKKENACGDKDPEPKKENICGEEKDPKKENKCRDKEKKYSEEEYSALEQKCFALEKENKELLEFKQSVELGKKQEMINSFYMLSEEDKADVVEHINEYSLDEIEGKLSVICFRNKVSFALNEEEKEEETPVTSFNVVEEESSLVKGSWQEAVANFQKNM